MSSHYNLTSSYYILSSLPSTNSLIGYHATHFLSSSSSPSANEPLRSVYMRQFRKRKRNLSLMFAVSQYVFYENHSHINVLCFSTSKSRSWTWGKLLSDLREGARKARSHPSLIIFQFHAVFLEKCKNKFTPLPQIHLENSGFATANFNSAIHKAAVFTVPSHSMTFTGTISENLWSRE